MSIFQIIIEVDVLVFMSVWSPCLYMCFI